jgi:hypothetical protein
MLSASASALAACDAQTRSGGAYDFVRGYPTDTAAQKAQDDADFQRAVSAYRFWYPTVSMEGIFNGNRQVGLADGQAMGIAATGVGTRQAEIHHPTLIVIVDQADEGTGR